VTQYAYATVAYIQTESKLMTRKELMGDFHKQVLLASQPNEKGFGGSGDLIWK
jgi:hypothetical protein